MTEILNIYHIEDKEEWVELVDEEISKVSGLNYIWVDKLPENLLSLAEQLLPPGIIIFDLRLRGDLSEHQTAEELFDLIPILQDKGSEIFILSGYIPNSVKFSFNAFGIPENNIFDKGNFIFSEFIENLIQAKNRIIGSYGKKQKKEYKILHLSDIHFGQEERNKRFHQDIRSEILRDVKKMIDRRGELDFIFIVGDTAYSGQESEYTQALEWLENLRTVAGCNSEASICVVPGNHDVNLEKITYTTHLVHQTIYDAKTDEDLTEMLYRLENDPEAIKLLLEKLENYRRFAEKLGFNFESFQKPFWTKDLPITNGPVIQLVGLNSVLFSSKEDEPGKLALAQNQYILHRKENLEYVLLMHHPVIWLKNYHTVSKYFENRARILMMGHDHQLKINEYRSISNYERLEFYSGATNPPSNNGNEFRFNYFNLSITENDHQKLIVDFWPRILSYNTSFVPDTNLLGGEKNKKYYISLD